MEVCHSSISALSGFFLFAFLMVFFFFPSSIMLRSGGLNLVFLFYCCLVSFIFQDYIRGGVTGQFSLK